MKKRIATFSALTAVFTLAFTAFSEDKKAVVNPADKPAETVSTAPVSAVFEYAASGRRDPFSPLIVKAEAKPAKSMVPIESYEITEFKVIAILWNKAGYYSVITLPDGKSYTIKEGMKMGLHGGKVYKITKDAVVIREHVRDYKGTLSPKDTILKLRREE